MSMHNHLIELERRHHALEKQIQSALVHPSSEPLQIAELKRKKLLVKDEIEKLRAKSQSQTVH